MCFKDIKNKGVKVQGEILNNLKFANDTMIPTENQDQLTEMLKDLKLETEKVELKQNIK